MRALPTLILALSLAAATRADEARAIAALTKQGAEMLRDEKAKGQPAVVVRFPARGPVKAVDLKPLADLPKLEAVDLAETPVRDADLAHLAGLAQLVDLSLAATGITDKGLA